ncbi:hypothetical protein RRF57_005229 [Xylaria bambusicola]|uniref:Uncharacterized protein n=1 Tax=Xylaria bambusicola TaxID=326684 RepID=A0AAN7ULR9_9PEZI
MPAPPPATRHDVSGLYVRLGLTTSTRGDTTGGRFPVSRYSPIRLVAADGGVFPSLPPILLDMANPKVYQPGLAPFVLDSN